MGSASHFYPNLKKRVAQKLRRIILLHIGLVCVRLHFPKIINICMCMIFGPSGNVHGPNQFFYIGPTKLPNIMQEKAKSFSKQHYFLAVSESQKSKMKKTRAEKSLRPVL